MFVIVSYQQKKDTTDHINQFRFPFEAKLNTQNKSF